MEYNIRMATPADAETIAFQRASMFFDIGGLTGAEAATMQRNSAPWLARLLKRGEYFGWLAEYNGAIVAGGGLHLRESGPTCFCLDVYDWVHIVNVYTDPAHRRRGLARRIMQAMVDWCDARGIVHITLAASDDGRPLYESLGFVPTNEMRLPRTSAARSQSSCETS